MKLSDFHPDEVEVVGDGNSTIGSGPKTSSMGGLRLSELAPHEVEIVEPSVDPKTSPVTSATTGIIEGAVPFAAPIAGIGKAAMNAITGVSGPLGGGSMDDILEDYRSGRNEFQQNAKRAREANPKTAFAGNIAGGFSNPLFQSADTLPKIAGASAVQGLGASEGDLTKGELKKTGQDVGYSTLGGMAGFGAGKVLPKLWEGVKYFGKKALTTLGPSEEAITARLAGGAQDNAKNYGALAEDFSGTMKKLKGQIAEKSGQANALLSADKDIPRPYIESALDDGIKGLQVAGKEGPVVFGPTDKSALKTLEGLKSDIADLPDTLSQQDLKKIIQKMDDNINWDDQSQNKLNQILEGLRHNFDSTLKFQNKGYAKAIEPVSERLQLMNDLKRQFNLKNVPGEGLVPTDTTATKMQSSLRDNKQVTQGNLEQLKGYTGDDYAAQAKDFQLANQFDRTGAQGSRRTVLGTALGGLIGHGNPVAMGAGALTGATLDKYGGKVLGKMIDGYVKAGNSQVFGKFAPILEKASEKGPDALAVAGSLLQNNPEFRALIDNMMPK